MTFEEIPEHERVSANAALRIDPPHPGLGIRVGCIGAEAAGQGGAGSIEEAAIMLGVERNDLAEVIQGRRAIWPDLALRLEGLGWGSAQAWLEMQHRYDLACVRRRQAASTSPTAQPPSTPDRANPIGRWARIEERPTQWQSGRVP